MPFRRWIAVLGCAIALAAAPRPAAAQQTPADTAAVLYDLAQRLRAEGRTDLAATILELIQTRYPQSPAAERTAALPPLREHGGTELTVWGTLYGLWLGAAVPAAFGAEQEEIYGLGLLVGGPSGFFGARAYDRRRHLTEGGVRTITFGGTWGTWQGYGWQEVFDFGVDNDTEEMLTAMIVGGLAGIVVGDQFTRRRDISAGTATAVTFGGLWGTYYGYSTMRLLEGDDDRFEGDTVLGWTLMGGNLGVLATALLAPRWELSRSRARLINIAGVAGLVAGLGLNMVTDADGRAATLIPMTTGALGLAAGAHVTRDEPAAGGGGSGGGAGALLRLRDGRLAFDLPAPAPALLRARPGGDLRPALRLPLLDARF